MTLLRIDYSRFLSGRVSYIEPSPIREMVSKIAKKSRETRVISFAAGEPDPDVIPRGLYAELAREVFEDKRSVNYSPTEGVLELREEIAVFMRRYEGVESTVDNIIVTLGGSQALDLVARLMLNPGEVVLTENPSYVNTILDWKQWGAIVTGVKIDENGLDTGELEVTVKRLKRDGRVVKLIYTIPTGQNPSGITMSNDRRKHLLEIASEHDLLVVEDGAYNYLVYEPLEVKSLKSMDSEGRVIFAGSFSKVLGTGLRIGWLHLPEELAEKFRVAKGPTDMCPPVPSQLLVLQILRRNLFEDIRGRAVETYKRKRDLMLKAIAEYMSELKHTKPIAGMFILLWLPSHIDGWKFSEEALEKYSVAVIPAAPFFTDNSGKSVIRLNFSMVPENDIEEGIKRLTQLIKEESLS
ncbi:MAG: PLP-dependent aminotransferase family protein [Desulfurococcaceae archaeon]|nr:PLP-dependent aminotransferase family protein [Desulfurococcaceae archaeon]